MQGFFIQPFSAPPPSFILGSQDSEANSLRTAQRYSPLSDYLCRDLSPLPSCRPAKLGGKARDFDAQYVAVSTLDVSTPMLMTTGATDAGRAGAPEKQ
jgi:hypothetical protein